MKKLSKQNEGGNATPHNIMIMHQSGPAQYASRYGGSASNQPSNMGLAVNSPKYKENVPNAGGPPSTLAVV